jgi:predicted kinase
MKVLYIVRGLSGSGKSSLAKEIVNPIWCSDRKSFFKDVYSADDYFTDEQGNYNFSPEFLADAHADCFSKVELAMTKDILKVVVANTFSQSWEAEPYFKLAKKYDYSSFVVECQNTFDNVHEVPQETIEAMRGRWETNLIKPTKERGFPVGEVDFGTNME